MKGSILIGVIHLLVAGVLGWKYHQDIATAQLNFRQEELLKSKDAVKKMEHLFHRIYEGLRTISRLSSIRNLEPDGKNFDSNANHTVQELYNNIANELSISEIYIVPLKFDPEPVDPSSSAPRAPTLMFDELIVGRVGGEFNPERLNHSDHPRIEEIEIEEYHSIKEQLKLMQMQFPTEDKFKGLNVPTFIGREVITCDNTHFDPTKPNDADRKGLVYSLPFYSPTGILKGCVSGIVLSSVVQDSLPSGHYILRNENSDYFVTSRRSKPTDEPPGREANPQNDSHLLGAEVFQLQLKDQTGQWSLWSGLSLDDFLKRNDVKMARQFAVLGYSAWAILGFGTWAAYFLTRKHQRTLERVNRTLRDQQILLKNSQEKVKQFSRRILNIREDEKKRLGSDLHDSIGTMAISLKAHLSQTESSIQKNDSKGALRDLGLAKRSVEQAVKELKKIAIDLRPLNLEIVGLKGALQELQTSFQKNSSIQFHFQIELDEGMITDPQAIGLYRIIQESLNNVVKHSRATNVTVQLKAIDGCLWTANESDPIKRQPSTFSAIMDEKMTHRGQLKLRIFDDGIGMDPQLLDPSAHLTMGIQGMLERAESLGGSLTIQSSMGKGVALTLNLELQPTAIAE
jgi:signal transduction histidine kinase